LKELFNRYLGNYQDRTAALTVASLIINAFFGIGKLILGVYLLSAWFMINAVYYLILCGARGQALKKYTVTKQIEDPEKRYNMEFAIYRRSGVFLCLLGISYLLVCLRMYLVGDATAYGGYTVFLVAVIAFTKLSFAIYGTVINRHLKNPIVSTLKIISFTDAMVSIVVTQCTLLIMQKSPNAVSNSAFLGMGCSVLFVLVGIFMFCRKKTYFQVKEHIEKGKRPNKRKVAEWLSKIPIRIGLNGIRYLFFPKSAREYQNRIADQIAIKIFKELTEQDPNCSCCCAVTVESGTIHIMGTAITMAKVDYVACAQEVIKGLDASRGARNGLATTRQIICSLQVQLPDRAVPMLTEAKDKS
jgi:S-adenosylmethionine synthetase